MIPGIFLRAMKGDVTVIVNMSYTGAELEGDGSQYYDMGMG